MKKQFTPQGKKTLPGHYTSSFLLWIHESFFSHPKVENVVSKGEAFKKILAASLLEKKIVGGDSGKEKKY